MKAFLSYLGAVLSLGFLVASGIINYTFGTRLADTPELQYVMGAVAVLAVGYNGLCPFLMQWWRSFTGKTLTAILWLLCLIYTATSAIGFAAENRTLAQGLQAARHANLGTYEDMLKDELAFSKKNHRKIEQLRLKIVDARTKGAGINPDPQTTLIAALTFLPEGIVKVALVVLFALLIEIGASVGLYASLGHTGHPHHVYDWGGRCLLCRHRQGE